MEDSILQVFGQRVREIRAEKELSQEKLGFLSGLDRTYISGVERGVRNVSLVNIAKIAKSLDVSPADLLSKVSE